MLISKDKAVRPSAGGKRIFRRTKALMSPSTATSARLRPETGRRARSIPRHLSAGCRSRRQTARSELTGCGAFWAVPSAKGSGLPETGSRSRSAPQPFFERVP